MGLTQKGQVTPTEVSDRDYPGGVAWQSEGLWLRWTGKIMTAVGCVYTVVFIDSYSLY